MTFQNVAIAAIGYLIALIIFIGFIRGVGAQERECEGEYD